MNISKLNEAFNTIVEKKAELHGVDASSNEFERRKHLIAKLEKAFQKEYGAYLHDVLFEVHDEFCSDNEVLLPIAYMASSYLKDSNSTYEVSTTEGVPVDADDFPGIAARLILMPNPIRLELRGQKADFKEVVWQGAD